MALPSVLVTFDSMKNNNSGYYYFGKGLGNALIDANRNKYDLHFYMHRRTAYRFEEQVDILYLSKLHKYYVPFRNKFDLVHLSDQECRLSPEKMNAKKIMTIHDMNRVHLQSGQPSQIEMYLAKLKRFIDTVDKIVAISEFVANDIRQYFPEAAHKISVIYNGADKLLVPENYRPTIVPDAPFLFTIGVLSVQKGFQYLPALLMDNNYHLVISGVETPNKQNIIAEAKKYQCLDRVHITGPVSDVDKAWYYKNCSAFLFPSRAEGFGLPVIEAMHFGKPVFLANYTSLPEVGGDVAYYFDSFEATHMQDVFNAGMDDFYRRNAVEDVIKQSEKFSWHRSAEQYLALYHECLK